MSSDHERNHDIAKLRDLVRSDDALRKELGSLTTGDELHAALARVGAENGLRVTEKEIEAWVTEQSAGTSDELSPDELASMAGRFHLYPPKTATVRFGDALIRTSRWFGIPLQRG